MTAKRTPTDAEMDALTAEFRSLWHAGEVVGPWLRKHQNRLRDLVYEGWSWASVGEALTKAGITYKTGRPWSAEVLRCDVKRASRPLKRRPARQVASQTNAHEPAPSPALAGAGASPRNTVGHASPPPTPRFKTAPAAPSAPPQAADQAHAKLHASPLPSTRFRPVSLEPEIKPHTLTPADLEERQRLRDKILGKKE